MKSRTRRTRRIPWAASEVSTMFAKPGEYSGLRVVVPIQALSEANRHSHWAAMKRRADEQRNALMVGFSTLSRPALPVVVTLTRLYRNTGGKTGGKQDDDNLRRSFKVCRDWIAAWMKVDDADPRIRFDYGQELGDVVGVRIQIERK